MAVVRGGDTISDAASNTIFLAAPTFPSRGSATEQVEWLRPRISAESPLSEQAGAIKALRDYLERCERMTTLRTLSAAYGERQYTVDVFNCVNRLGLDSFLKRTTLAILLPRDAYAAICLHEELSAGMFPIFLLSETQEVADTYDSLYGFQSFNNLIENFCDENFKKLLRERFCKQKVVVSQDDDVVMEDREHLYDMGKTLYLLIKELPNSPEKRITKILEGTTDESRKEIMDAYDKFSYSKNMETDLMTVTGGNLGNFHRGFLALMQSSVNRPKYYAQVLAKALLGNRNQIDHETILSIITTRAKMDMNEIKIEFEREYRTSLHEAVYNAFSGHVCRDDLLLLLNWNDMN